MRPLEASARKKGVKFLLNYHMDVIFREQPNSGRVLGIQASYTPTILPGTTTPLKSFRTDGNIDMTAKTVTVKANKAVIIGTGGSTGNVNFRRMFDPRLTEEFPLAGERVLAPGRQRRAGGDGGRRLAVGHGQPDHGSQRLPAQAADHRHAYELRRLDAGKPHLPRSAPPASASATGRTRSSSTRWASASTTRWKTAIPTAPPKASDTS